MVGLDHLCHLGRRHPRQIGIGVKAQLGTARSRQRAGVSHRPQRSARHARACRRHCHASCSTAMAKRDDSIRLFAKDRELLDHKADIAIACHQLLGLVQALRQ
jgi:hypothetical protein